MPALFHGRFFCRHRKKEIIPQPDAQLQQILEQGGASSEATVSFEAVDATPEPAADATPAPDGGSDAADPAAAENTGTGE